MNPYKFFTIALTALVVFFIIITATAKADPAHRGSCVTAKAKTTMTFAPINIVAKAKSPTTPNPVPPPKAKKEKVTIITITYKNPTGPGSTIPDAPADTAAAHIRDSGLVESHVVPRYYVVVGE